MRIQIVELMGNNVNKLNEVKNLLNKISDEDDFNFLKEIEKIHDCNQNKSLKNEIKTNENKH